MRRTVQRALHGKNIFFLAVLMWVTIDANAQILEPVHWTVEGKKLTEHDFELIYAATIDPSWHLYSQFIKPNGPTPTSFDLEASTNFTQPGKVTEEEGHTVYEELFNMPVKYFKGQAAFVQKIKKATTDKVTLMGEITFMSCNNEPCVPGYFDIETELQ